MKKFFSRLAVVLVSLYLVVGVALYFLQDRLLLRAEVLPADYHFEFDIPHTELNIPFDDGSTINMIRFHSTDTITRGVVLYFHGNRKNIERYIRWVPDFTRNGYEVWMPDYPGFGKSTGTFSEQRVYDCALKVYDLALANFQPNSIVIYGKSLGTGVAAQLAAIRDCKHLVLETPYYSLPSLMNQYLPVYPSAILRYDFPTWQYVKAVKKPITIFHGTDDRVIPYDNAKRLIPFLKAGDRFITIPEGEHYGLPRHEFFQQALDSLLSRAN